MQKSAGSDNKNAAIRFIRILLVLLALCAAPLRLRLLDSFYASAIPDDPIRMGMTPREIRSFLGAPDDKWVLEYYISTGFLTGGGS